jgi:hypothetical protein
MKKAKSTTMWWERRGDDAPPLEYNQCYRRALRRMAVTLNCHRRRGSLFSVAALKKSDIQLQNTFQQKKVGSIDADAMLVNHELVDRHQELEDFDQAENLFYGDFDFSCPRGFQNIVRVTHRSTPAFRKWSFERLLWPTIQTSQGEPERLEKQSGETDAEFMMSCASNYLLKNFWHNYVHRQIQGIASHNYHSFGGEARDHSDFTADNLATILFARSYGIEILASGRSGPDRSTAVRDLLNRNRCNLVFAERDRYRIESTTEMDANERWREAQWQFRRRVAMATSNQLVARGAAATSLAVYLRGERRSRDDWFYHKELVVVEINGRYFVSNQYSYIPDPAKPMNAHTRKTAYERREKIAINAIDQYTSLLEQVSELRSYAKQSLEALAERISVPL